MIYYQKSHQLIWVFWENSDSEAISITGNWFTNSKIISTFKEWNSILQTTVLENHTYVTAHYWIMNLFN